MKRMKIVGLLLLLAIMVVPYFNCSQAPTGGLFDQAANCSNDNGNGCNGDFSKVYFSGTIQPPRLALNGSFTLTGACSDGGFPKAMVSWELKTANSALVNSGQAQCNSGQFNIFGNVPVNYAQVPNQYLVLILHVYDQVSSTTFVNGDRAPTTMVPVIPAQ